MSSIWLSLVVAVVALFMVAAQEQAAIAVLLLANHLAAERPQNQDCLSSPTLPTRSLLAAAAVLASATPAEPKAPTPFFQPSLPKVAVWARTAQTAATAVLAVALVFRRSVGAQTAEPQQPIRGTTEVLVETLAVLTLLVVAVVVLVRLAGQPRQILAARVETVLLHT
jgi:hypothetical protein